MSKAVRWEADRGLSLSVEVKGGDMSSRHARRRLLLFEQQDKGRVQYNGEGRRAQQWCVRLLVASTW